jgi:hypothetical protein
VHETDGHLFPRVNWSHTWHMSFCFFLSYYGHSLCNAIQVCMPPQGSAGTIYKLVASTSGEHACNATHRQPAHRSIDTFLRPLLISSEIEWKPCRARMVPDTVRVAVGILGVCSSITCTSTCCSDHITISWIILCTHANLSLSCRQCCFHAPLRNPYVCVYIS